MCLNHNSQAWWHDVEHGAIKFEQILFSLFTTFPLLCPELVKGLEANL